MASALITVVKTYGGKSWENTHCVGIGSDFTTPPNDFFLSTIGCGDPLTTAAVASPTSFLQRLLAFERAMHRAAVLLTKIYVTDGKRNRLGFTEFFTSALSIPGTLASGADTGMFAPGSIVIQVNRNPSGFSHRPGRMFIRGCLLDTNVIFNGPRMLDWTSSADQSATAGFLSSAVATGLSTHFNGGTNAANGIYCIPHFRRTKPAPPPPNQEGELIDAWPVASITLGNPVNRQTRRGRRRRNP